MAENIIRWISSELTGNLSVQESPSDSEDILFISKKRLEAEMPRLTGYAERVVPMQTETEFHSYFRLSSDTVLVVQDMICKSL